jgi:hypothetical protein
MDHSPQNLPSHGTPQGQRDEFPAIARFNPQVNDKGDGNVYIKIPAEAEFIIILSQIAERKVDYDGEEYESQKNKNVVHVLPLKA